MKRPINALFDRLPLWALAFGAFLLIAAVGVWALRPLPAPPEFPVVADAPAPESGEGGRPDRVAVPAGALAVTLRDPLIEPSATPVVDELPPPPPRLALELIAILGAGDDRAAFVRTIADGRYAELRPGDRTDQGAEVVGIGPRSALFRLGGRDIEVELNP